MERDFSPVRPCFQLSKLNWSLLPRTFISASFLKVIVSIVVGTLLFNVERGDAKEVVLTAMNYPPFYGEALSNDGPLAQMVVESFKIAGYKTQIVYQPWKRAMATARAGHYADGMLGVWHTVQREQDFFYSAPILPNEMVFFKRKSMELADSDYASLAARGYKLGVVRGYVVPQGLLESKIAVEWVTHDVQNIQMLAAGRIDLVVLDRDYANYMLQGYPKVFAAIERVGPVLQSKQQHLIISKKTKNALTLIRDFDRGLKRLRDSGEYLKYVDQLRSRGVSALSSSENE